MENELETEKVAVCPMCKGRKQIWSNEFPDLGQWNFVHSMNHNVCEGKGFVVYKTKMIETATSA